MRLVFAAGLMLLAGLVTATVAMITVRLMHAHNSANDRQPVPITHAADVFGHRMSGLIGTPPECGRRYCRPPPSPAACGWQMGPEGLGVELFSQIYYPRASWYALAPSDGCHHGVG
jgi:hypothetical protein